MLPPPDWVASGPRTGRVGCPVPEVQAAPPGRVPVESAIRSRQLPPGGHLCGSAIL